MQTEKTPQTLERPEKQTGLAEMVKGWEEKCKICHPLTLTTCITNCKIWGSKNELRKLYGKLKNANFTKNLFNTLKNERRLQILELISKNQCPVTTIQQELKKRGYNHSQQTITDEYLAPLMEVGLAEENTNRYHATLFGCQLVKSTKNLHDIEDVLPPHSECYEETVLHTLLTAPKTFDDLKAAIPAKSVARVLNRLRQTGIIEVTKEKDYIFYFKTKRDSNWTKFSPTEKRVYENILENGVSAQKLAEKTLISLRRTYKYLRRLKGKKMVFSRKKPKNYALTVKGFQIASILEEVGELTVEVLGTATQYVRNHETHYLPVPDTSYIMRTNEPRK